MDIVAFDSPSDFQERVYDFLAQDEALHSLPIGLIFDLAGGRRFGPEAPLLYSVEVGGVVCGIALQTPPHPMNLVSGHPKCMASLVPYVREKGVMPSWISGVKSTCLEFAELWKAATGQEATIHTNMCLHQLMSVCMPSPKAVGFMRKPRASEKKQMCQWAYRFAVDCNLKVGIERGVPDTVAPMERGDLYVWDVANRAVGCAALSRRSPNGATISFVYTPDGERGNGYASALVAHLSQSILDTGKDYCVLFTDLSNPTSNKIYSDVGYVPLSDFLMLDLA